MSQERAQDGLAGGTGRALVALDRGEADGGGAARPLAQFVAQLIACRRGLASYRRARKAEPGSARVAYAPAAPPVRPMRLDVSF